MVHSRVVASPSGLMAPSHGALWAHGTFCFLGLNYHHRTTSPLRVRRRTRLRQAHLGVPERAIPGGAIPGGAIPLQAAPAGQAGRAF